MGDCSAIDQVFQSCAQFYQQNEQNDAGGMFITAQVALTYSQSDGTVCYAEGFLTYTPAEIEVKIPPRGGPPFSVTFPPPFSSVSVPASLAGPLRAYFNTSRWQPWVDSEPFPFDPQNGAIQSLNVSIRNSEGAYSACFTGDAPISVPVDTGELAPLYEPLNCSNGVLYGVGNPIDTTTQNALYTISIFNVQNSPRFE